MHAHYLFSALPCALPPCLIIFVQFWAFNQNLKITTMIELKN